MEVILKQDIPRLGYKDEIVTVKDGYARNYLIPRGLAIEATPSAKKQLQEIIKQRKHKEEKLRQEAISLAEQLKSVKITIGAKTSSKGKIFGSVNPVQIAEALKEKGFDIDRRNIIFKEGAIKEIGTYTAIINLYKDIKAEVAFEVISE